MIHNFAREYPLHQLATLRAGGNAEYFAVAESREELAEIAIYAQVSGLHMTVLGAGSNILPSDAGVPGLTVLNQANDIDIGSGGVVRASCGVAIQELFLKTAQAGLHGFEFAVGIPGTLGGALVSNAGAYRSNVSEFLVELDIVFEGERKTVGPDFMKFSYRDSLLRKLDPPQCALLSATFNLPFGDTKEIYDDAREFQRQRIGKQPAPASAGSFFKNVNDKSLAESLASLPDGLKEAGVVPAGYLNEAVGMRGFAFQGAMMSQRHANFMLNVGDADATTIRDLAEHVKRKVFARFGVELEEEVLYLGDWSEYKVTEIVE